MKCPICHVDHFMLCHSCPHANEVAGHEYKGSPCEACAKDYRGRLRENDSREIGHSRVVSLQKLERYIGDSIASDAEPSEVTAAAAALQDFVKRFCSLGIRVQFMLEQREFFGKSLEEVADMYSREFGETLTPAGVSAALKSATRRMRGLSK